MLSRRKSKTDVAVTEAIQLIKTMRDYKIQIFVPFLLLFFFPFSIFFFG